MEIKKNQIVKVQEQKEQQNKIKSQPMNKNFEKEKFFRGIDGLYDQKLKETLLYVKNKGILKINYDIKTETQKELEDYFKEGLKNFLEGEYQEAHEMLSKIRKEGKEASVFTFKIMQIPIKIKTFLATGELNDFLKITKKIDEIKKECESIKKK
jgi:hypothetical protein